MAGFPTDQERCAGWPVIKNSRYQQLVSMDERHRSDATSMGRYFSLSRSHPTKGAWLEIDPRSWWTWPPLCSARSRSRTHRCFVAFAGTLPFHHRSFPYDVDRPRSSLDYGSKPATWTDGAMEPIRQAPAESCWWASASWDERSGTRAPSTIDHLRRRRGDSQSALLVGSFCLNSRGVFHMSLCVLETSYEGIFVWLILPPLISHSFLLPLQTSNLFLSSSSSDL